MRPPHHILKIFLPGILFAAVFAVLSFAVNCVSNGAYGCTFWTLAAPPAPISSDNLQASFTNQTSTSVTVSWQNNGNPSGTTYFIKAVAGSDATNSNAVILASATVQQGSSGLSTSVNLNFDISGNCTGSNGGCDILAAAYNGDSVNFPGGGGVPPGQPDPSPPVSLGILINSQLPGPSKVYVITANPELSGAAGVNDSTTTNTSLTLGVELQEPLQNFDTSKLLVSVQYFDGVNITTRTLVPTSLSGWDLTVQIKDLKPNTNYSGSLSAAVGWNNCSKDGNPFYCPIVEPGSLSSYTSAQYPSSPQAWTRPSAVTTLAEAKGTKNQDGSVSVPVTVTFPTGQLANPQGTTYSYVITNQTNSDGTPNFDTSIALSTGAIPCDSSCQNSGQANITAIVANPPPNITSYIEVISSSTAPLPRNLSVAFVSSFTLIGYSAPGLVTVDASGDNQGSSDTITTSNYFTLDITPANGEANFPVQDYMAVVSYSTAPLSPITTTYGLIPVSQNNGILKVQIPFQNPNQQAYNVKAALAFPNTNTPQNNTASNYNPGTLSDFTGAALQDAWTRPDAPTVTGTAAADSTTGSISFIIPSDNPNNATYVIQAVQIGTADNPPTDTQSVNWTNIVASSSVVLSPGSYTVNLEDLNSNGVYAVRVLAVSGSHASRPGLDTPSNPYELLMTSLKQPTQAFIYTLNDSASPDHNTTPSAFTIEVQPGQQNLSASNLMLQVTYTDSYGKSYTASAAADTSDTPKNTGDFLFVIPLQEANTANQSFTITSAQIALSNGYGSINQSSLSPSVQVTVPPNPWTRPDAPTVTGTSAANTTTGSVSFIVPSDNPNNATYVIQAVQIGTVDNPPTDTQSVNWVNITSSASFVLNPGNYTESLTGLNSNGVYAVRVLAVSGNESVRPGLDTPSNAYELLMTSLKKPTQAFIYTQNDSASPDHNTTPSAFTIEVQPGQQNLSASSLMLQITYKDSSGNSYTAAAAAETTDTPKNTGDLLFIVPMQEANTANQSFTITSAQIALSNGYGSINQSSLSPSVTVSGTPWTRPDAPALNQPLVSGNTVTITVMNPSDNPSNTPYVLYYAASLNNGNLVDPSSITFTTQQTSATFTLGLGTWYFQYVAQTLCPTRAGLSVASAVSTVPIYAFLTPEGVTYDPTATTYNSIRLVADLNSGSNANLPSLIVATGTYTDHNGAIKTLNVSINAHAYNPENLADVTEVYADVPGLPGNSQVTITQVQFCGSTGNNVPDANSCSAPLILTPGSRDYPPVTAYTLPYAPQTPAVNIGQGTMYAIIGGNGDNVLQENTDITSYCLQASLDSVFGTPNGIHTSTFCVTNQGNPGAPVTVSITGLVGGLPYSFRIESVGSGNPPLVTYSSASVPMPAGYPPGIVTDDESSSLTVQWTVGVAGKFEAVAATDPNSLQGQPYSAEINNSSQIDNPAPSNLTINNLQANTTYYVNLMQYNTLNGASEWNPLAGSEVTAITKAVSPLAPILTLSGTSTTGLNMNVSLSTGDTNASDSLYALQLSLPDGSQPYITGQSTSVDPVWNTLSYWNSHPTGLRNVQVGALYSVTALVQQKLDGSTIASPAASLVIPGGLSVSTFVVTGMSVDNIFFGVPISSSVEVDFNGVVSTPSLSGNIVLEKMVNGAFQPLNAGWNYQDDGVNHRLFLTPAGTAYWAPNSIYRITINPGITSVQGFATTFTSQVIFMTAPDPAAGGTIQSINSNGASSLSISVGANALAAGQYIVPRTSFISPNSPVSASAGTLNKLFGSQGLTRAMETVEVLFYSANASLQNVNAPLQAVTLTLYPNRVASTMSRSISIDPKTYTICMIDSNGNMTTLPSTINSDGSVSAQIYQSAVYVLAGSLMVSLDSAYAYPVPFRPASGHTIITFKNLAANSTIKVFTIMGELVWQGQNDQNQDVIPWNVTNRDGDHVASGVYIYQIKNSYSEKRGKLIIIR